MAVMQLVKSGKLTTTKVGRRFGMSYNRAHPFFITDLVTSRHGL